MESGVQKKKLNKGKLRKTIKNVLCRPDPLQWPVISDEHKNSLEVALAKYKLDLPEFKKPHWKEVKLIPKEKRAKAPKIEKHDGILFGIRECIHAVKVKQCSGVLIESMVNPRIIVQPLLEACNEENIPFLCVQNLRETSQQYFGIPASALGVKSNHLIDISNQIIDIAKCYTVSQDKPITNEIKDDEMVTIHDTEKAIPISNSQNNDAKICPYLYRTGKTRIFVPSGATESAKTIKNFRGQNYIEFSDKLTEKKGTEGVYMKMMLKRVSSNPNRKSGKTKIG